VGGPPKFKFKKKKFSFFCDGRASIDLAHHKTKWEQSFFDSPKIDTIVCCSLLLLLWAGGGLGFTQRVERELRAKQTHCGDITCSAAM
jgi:hypothetical protein